ncbi:MAG: endonuclease III, partial [Candidatus Hodarchaeales archaeon]
SINPFELLVATILSAQTTDKAVNNITPFFFKKFPNSYSLAKAEIEEIIEIIKPLGLYNNKAKSLLKMAKSLVEIYNGEVPNTMKELVKLSGVGRKTANVVLGNSFGIKDSGITIDTHMIRIMKRLKWVKEEGNNAFRIEKELMEIIPVKYWVDITHLIIDHGRTICTPRNPKCNKCVIKVICPSSK